MDIMWAKMKNFIKIKWRKIIDIICNLYRYIFWFNQNPDPLPTLPHPTPSAPLPIPHHNKNILYKLYNIHISILSVQIL